MRPILIIVAVLAAAMGFLYVFRGAPDEPRPPRQGTQVRQVQAPQNQRPQTGGATRTVQGEMGEITVNIPDELEARFEAGVLSWRDMVSDDYLVRVEDAWDVDLTGVDLDAEVLCVVDGVEITRDMLRSRVLLEHGQAALNARLFSILGKLAAAETGVPYGLSDEEWSGYWNEWTGSRGLDADSAKAYLAVKLGVPVEQVEPLRRQMVEAVLACLPPVESYDELPLGLGDVFAGPDEQERAAMVGNLMRESIQKLGQGSEGGGYGTPVAGLVEPMSGLFARMGSESRFRRAWTCLDADLPPGVLAGFFTGDLDPDQITPPWQIPGDRELVLIDELWEQVGPALGEQVLRSELREVVRNEVARAKLTDLGKLPTAEQAWGRFAQDYLANKMTFFDLDMMMQMEGYPGRTFYIEDKAIIAGVLASQSEGWDAEETLRDFFEANRFFVLGWEPRLELALFQPRDPRWEPDREADWDLALSQAQEFCDRVAQGEDFTELRTAQNRSILDAYREVNEELADSFAAEFGTGEFNQTLAMANQTLRHSVYRDHLDGASVMRNAVIRLESGDVSPPWKTPIGYVVVRMHDAQVRTLEREYEDVEGITRFEYEQHLIRRWMTDNLGKLEVEIPGS